MKTKTVKGNRRMNKLDLPSVFLICIFFFLAGFSASSLFSPSQVFLLNTPNLITLFFHILRLFSFDFVLFSWKIFGVTDRWEFAGTWIWPEADTESEVTWKIDAREDGASFVESRRLRRRLRYIDSFSGAHLASSVLRDFPLKRSSASYLLRWSRYFVIPVWNSAMWCELVY